MTTWLTVRDVGVVVLKSQTKSSRKSESVLLLHPRCPLVDDDGPVVRILELLHLDFEADLSGMANELVAELLRVVRDMVGEALCDRDPDHVRGQEQRMVMAERQVNRFGERMISRCLHHLEPRPDDCTPGARSGNTPSTSTLRS